MSYNLHISRKEFYVDEEGEDIKQEDFDECIKGEDIEKVSDDEYVWKGIPDKDLEEVSFWYENEFGSITTKNPEPETIKKNVYSCKKIKSRSTR